VALNLVVADVAAVLAVGPGNGNEVVLFLKGPQGDGSLGGAEVSDNGLLVGRARLDGAGLGGTAREGEQQSGDTMTGGHGGSLLDRLRLCPGSCG